VFMKLLEENEERGYPLEYLLSRVRGRRVSLITDWEHLIRAENLFEALSSLHHGKIGIDSADALWRRLLTEFRWVFSQMDRTLREIFRPFFQYSELRTLFFCLRYKMNGETVRLEQVLVQSLFSKQFKRILRRNEDILDTVEAVEEAFIGLSPRFKGIREVFLKDGLKGVEQKLTNTYLEHLIQSELHPLIRAFFTRIIDARNLIALYKYLRWEVEGTPRFIAGGRIGERRLRETKDKANIFGVMSIVRALTGMDVEKPDASGVENALYRGMTRFLKTASRETSGIGLILNYLWCCSMEARNLGVLLYGGDAEREAVLAEMVR